ncbi:hypothetical protein HG537_0C03220 [Torulaspora globosa]|uniref:AB hydrolase-1 domain-containing protein n=1 Tax=Torulaspora globosa TaxID=48254 RepID=A0A7H9HPE9_9SACH|nr:hypothetical protein HG537_0C03220 [Torulaspora sp. CBS 2947]
MGTNSISTSNRSIKSSTQSGNIVGRDSGVFEQMNSDNSRNDAPTGAREEQQPLLHENTGQQNKPSHRAIGIQPNPSSDIDEDNIERAQSESYLQRRLHKVHRQYRLFIHNAKWVLNILIVINTVFLVGTLISDFFFDINLFGSYNRINSFNDFTLLFISIIANGFNLWFNKLGLYSSLDYVLNIVLCLLTLINLEFIYLVAYTRRRIGFMGTFIYLWAAFSFFVGVVLDWYLLDYNKQIKEPFEDSENEEAEQDRMARQRVIPGASGRHTLSEWIVIGIRNIVKSLLLLFFILFTFNTLLSAWDIHRVTRRMADVSTEAASYDAFHWVDDSHSHKLHIRCYGDVFDDEEEVEDEKKQAILLYEHGGFDTGYLSATWIQELYHLNRIQRYCTYERPGYGLSDSAPAPISIAMVADSLKHALLNEANIKGPFVTVGYDLGGLFTQVFTAKNLDLIEGMMLVESWHEDLLLKNYLQRLLPPERGGDDDDDDQPGRDPDDLSRLPREIRRYSEWKVWWHGLWSTIGIKLQTSWLLAHHGSNERIYGRDMQYQGKFLRGKFLETVTSSLLSYKDVINYKEKLKNVKTSVVSSKEMVKKSPQWGNWQRELSKISSKTQEWKVVDGGHEVYKYGLGKQQAQDVLLRLIGEKDKY